MPRYAFVGCANPPLQTAVNGLSIPFSEPSSPQIVAYKLVGPPMDENGDAIAATAAPQSVTLPESPFESASGQGGFIQHRSCEHRRWLVSTLTLGTGVTPFKRRPHICRIGDALPFQNEAIRPQLQASEGPRNRRQSTGVRDAVAFGRDIYGPSNGARTSSKKAFRLSQSQSHLATPPPFPPERTFLPSPTLAYTYLFMIPSMASVVLAVHVLRTFAPKTVFKTMVSQPRYT